MHAFLVHRDGDTVGVAIREIELGEVAEGLVLDGGGRKQVEAASSIAMGHKVALHEVAVGGVVIEYGVPIGEATAQIRKGDHVHVHNLRSIRWHQSVAAVPNSATKSGPTETKR